MPEGDARMDLFWSAVAEKAGCPEFFPPKRVCSKKSTTQCRGQSGKVCSVQWPTCEEIKTADDQWGVDNGALCDQGYFMRPEEDFKFPISIAASLEHLTVDPGDPSTTQMDNSHWHPFCKNVEGDIERIATVDTYAIPGYHDDLPEAERNNLLWAKAAALSGCPDWPGGFPSTDTNYVPPSEVIKVKEEEPYSYTPMIVAFIVFVTLLGALLGVMYKFREELEGVLSHVFSEGGVLLLCLCAESVDLFTDVNVCAQIIKTDDPVLKEYQTQYSMLTGLAVVTGVGAIGLRFYTSRMMCTAINEHRSASASSIVPDEQVTQGGPTSKVGTKKLLKPFQDSTGHSLFDTSMEKKRWEKEAFKRASIQDWITLLTLVCEDVPLTVQNIILVFSAKVTSDAVIGSLLVSALMIGTKSMAISNLLVNRARAQGAQEDIDLLGVFKDTMKHFDTNDLSQEETDSILHAISSKVTEDTTSSSAFSGQTILAYSDLASEGAKGLFPI